MGLKAYAKIFGAKLILIYSNLTLHNTVILPSTKVLDSLTKVL